MRNTRIKVCGLRDTGTIRQLDGLPLDEIGLMFAPSKRQVTPAQATELIEAARGIAVRSGARPRMVGVFVNESLAALQELLRTVRLDAVQLHGAEGPDVCREAREQLGVQVWKALSVHAAGSTQLEIEQAVGRYQGAVDAILIDTAGGGTGQPFDWSQIPGYAAAAKAIGVPLYVAGGLHPGNVADLLGAYAPDGVDVSSGIETEGKKDIAKIRSFVERVSSNE